MPNVKMNSWMAELDDGKALVELCLPASHDAGVYQDKGVNPGPKACCQFGPIYKQAEYGSRVFDIRCFLRTKGIINKTKTPTMGHFFKEGKDGTLGDYGGTLLAALDDACSFVNIFRSEFIIFRIGHTKCTTDVAKVLKAYREDQETNGGCIFTSQGGGKDLSLLTVQELRGKVLLVFDKEFHTPNLYGTSDGYHLYYKYPSFGQNGGLTFCGKYVGGLGKAFARNKEDKGNWSPEGAQKLAYDACDEHLNKHTGSHLLWIYWQETGGNVLENTQAEKGMHNRLGEFLLTFWDNKKVTGWPNIIGHDFVNETTCAQIARANPELRKKL